VPVAAPGVIVAAQRAGVVLQLDQVQSAFAEHQQIDLVPLTVTVAELEVRPGAERVTLRKERADKVQALGLMGELGRRHLDPALQCSRHGAASPLP
jgi:hypothetical protein